jgi:hypothetical protein
MPAKLEVVKSAHEMLVKYVNQADPAPHLVIESEEDLTGTAFVKRGKYWIIALDEARAIVDLPELAASHWKEESERKLALAHQASILGGRPDAKKKGE